MVTYASRSDKLVLWGRAFVFCASRSRFSIIILVAGLAMVLTDQGRDLMISYSENGMKTSLLVACSAAIWAFSIWGWCRLLLDVRYLDPPSFTQAYNFWRKWIPRILGSLAFLILAFGAYQTGQKMLTAWFLAGFAVFLGFVIVRRPVTRRITDRLVSSKREFVKSFAEKLKPSDIDSQTEPPYTDLREALGLRNTGFKPIGKRYRLLALVVFAVFLSFVGLSALGIFYPVWLGRRSGAMSLFFLWGATWLPVGSWMSYFADKRGIPLLSALVIVAIISSYNNDNHEIRPAPEGKCVCERPSVSDALNSWVAANGAPNTKEVPFVVVATAGGGIRAAYWTATILGDLYDHSPVFPQRSFAISGVSGGSVGATVFRALLSVPTATFTRSCPPPKGMTECSQKILGKDFLAPVMAAALYSDLAQRFFPFPVYPDRGTALEKSWEASFKEVIGEDRMQDSLGSLGLTPQLPALFLNATWVDNGRRIVASNLKFDAHNPTEATAFARSNDQLDRLRYDLRLSTAAHNSARFPVVSPPGMWKRDGKIVGMLQDGGLFENYGAETALEILDLACRTFSCPSETQAGNRAANTKRGILPIVILISSDPSLPKDLTKSTEEKSLEFAYELRATLRTYERTRVGRGAEAASRLEAWTADHNGKFFHFHMCDGTSDNDKPPLGWALSEAAKTKINSYLFGVADSSKAPACYPDNAKQRDDLIDLLNKPI